MTGRLSRCIIAFLMLTAICAPMRAIAATDVRPREVSPLVISDLNMQVDLTRAISSSFRFASVNCLAGSTSFPTVASIAKSIRLYPERWNQMRTLFCRPLAEFDSYTFTISGTATSGDAELMDGVVVARCSFGANVTFRMKVELGTQVDDFLRLQVTEPFRFPVTCGFRISSASRAFTVTGSVVGLASTDVVAPNCVRGIRACVTFSLSEAGVKITSASGTYGGSVGVGTFDHSDILQLPELVQLSYLLDTARINDVETAAVAPVEIPDVPPTMSLMRLQFLIGVPLSSLLRPVSADVRRAPTVSLGGDVSVSTAPGTVCRMYMSNDGKRVLLGSRTATSLGLATWLISAQVRERVAIGLADRSGAIQTTVTAVCTTIDTRAVMTRRIVLE